MTSYNFDIAKVSTCKLLKSLKFIFIVDKLKGIDEKRHIGGESQAEEMGMYFPFTACLGMV